MTTPRPPRTIFTTLFGLAGIVAGGLGSIFSAFALLLALGKPYAHGSPADPLGIFLIFILPPGTLMAGICLLFRHRWARWWMVFLTIGIIGLGVKGLIAPDHANPAYAPLPGPAADAMRRGSAIGSVSGIVLGGLGLLGLFSRPVRREFSSNQSMSMPTSTSGESWRVSHTGRDMMFYEEFHGGQWERIAIDGEMLTGRAHHVIFFADAETWQRYPEWARHRRDEIIARIKSRFREPDYEYAGGGTASSAVLPIIPVAPPRLPANDGSILPMLAFLVFIAAASFGFAARGLARGELRLPAKHNPASRMVSRAEKPALFWASFGTLAGLGTGSAAFAAWLIATRRKGNP